MEYMVLVLIIFSYFLANIFQNRLSASLKGRIYPSNLFQVTWMLLASFMFAAAGLITGGLHFSSYTVRMGALAGVCTITGGMCLLGAMAMGPLSLTILIFSMYVIVAPALSVVFLNEKVTICQVIGMLLILAVLLLSNYSREGGKGRRSRVWWLLCLGSVAGTGLSNYVMKVHQYRMPNQDVLEYSVASYGSGVICAAVLALFFWRNAGKAPDASPYRFTWKSFFGPAIGMAVTEGIANLGNLYNVSRLPAIVLYPVSQLGTLMLTVLFGITALREKLTRVSAACLILGTAAIILMNF